MLQTICVLLVFKVIVKIIIIDGRLRSVLMQKLIVDGKLIEMDANYSMRWVERVDQPAIPVLYKHGKRVVKSWSIVLQHDEPEDPFGGNANTN